VKHPPTRETVVEIARLMADTKCSNVRILDLRGVSPVCDYFIIGTGTSGRQMRSVAEEVGEFAAERGLRSFGKTGTGENWIAIDLIEVVVHVFSHEGRQHYDLDNLFEATDVPWKRES
jgi:ribosome-associated protein